jgi:hypothetical protein
MVPRWEIIGLMLLSLVGMAIAIYASPNSYAYVSLTGQCARANPPAACHPPGARGAGGFRAAPHW